MLVTPHIPILFLLFFCLIFIGKRKEARSTIMVMATLRERKKNVKEIKAMVSLKEGVLLLLLININIKVLEHKSIFFFFTAIIVYKKKNTDVYSDKIATHRCSYVSSHSYRLPIELYYIPKRAKKNMR